MFRVCWGLEGDRYFFKSEVFYDLQDARNYLRMLKREGDYEAHMEKAEWKRYPTVKWTNNDN